MIGTLVAYLGGEYWDIISPASPDGHHVDREYFAQVSQVIPLLLIAIGFEARYFAKVVKRRGGLAVTAVTIGMLCLGEALVLTLLPTGPPRSRGAEWFEFWAFTISIEACFIGIILLLSALVGEARHASQADKSASVSADT